MTDTTHQGYKNYETFIVALWLDNDEGLYLQGREKVQDAITGEEDRAQALGQAAEVLKEWIGGMQPDLDAPFSDLLSGALSEVDWHEVAETRLRE